ncbi:transcriptional regulator [Lacihabitans sp. CCS-44]|jgi:DNA-binding HxlR family transcriptional regulator|uniref:winged helix-turn-helix transcriptional regulator n=1 Tax=Lacihabitans sp. CCS-44 TaxID=2487331 RepID=UPI0020CDE6F9|nr:helix-turn-helix domain-containing protein [Lacihabitans sp. CCS-44]MCP9754795.1 transcriptional regulator [Lacihabitans sp. CCS-44]
MKLKKRKSDCPIHFGLELFGDKWTLLIIRDLMFKGKHYFGDFINSEEKIATNVLSDRLALLEKEGIIAMFKDENHKQKIVYKLTTKGIDLMPVLVEIIMWSAKYDKDTAVEMEFVRNYNKDRGALIRQISSRLIDELGVL